jgi:Bacterial TSP3 repeat/Lectin C-type domain/Immunoglobulin I-set domain
LVPRRHRPDCPPIMNRFLLAAMLCTLAWISSAAPILDNFDDLAINTNLWTVLLPSGAAQVSLATGRAVLQSGGGLSPISDYLCNVEVQGRVRFAGTADRFEVVLRSSLSLASPTGNRTGLSIFFDQTNNVIGLNEVGIGLLVSKRFTFHPNEDVIFKITDDGENVSIYVNNLTTPFITDFSLIRTGNKIAFYNRDVSGAQSELDFLQIGSEEKCPSITSHPRNFNTLEHSNALFSVQAAGLPPLAYQWYFNQTIIPQGTSQSLLLTNLALSQAGKYLVVVSNSFGAVTSNPALLVLRPDTDGDGLADDEESATTNRYVIVSGSFTWHEAKTNAEARGGHLATFTTAAEWQFVYTNFGAALQGLFLGGTDEGTEGTWRWITGEPWSFTYWLQSEPDNAAGIQHYLRVLPGILWSDDYPYVRDGYLLEFDNWSDPNKVDTDGDGLSDYDEIRIYKTSPSNADTDGDGLTDFEEIMIYHTNPLKADTDGDKLSDFVEVTVHHTDPLKADTDGDGLSDGAEVLVYHSDPHKTDTDGDGFSDQTEVYTGKNPNDSNDYPTALLNIFHAVEVEIASRTGVVYQIQTSTNLQTWKNLDAPFTGDGQFVRKLYPARENSKLFYRVEVVGP